MISICILLLTPAVWQNVAKPSVRSSSSVPETFALTGLEQDNFKVQTYNDCGPFSTTFIVNHLNPELKLTPEIVIEQIDWRLPYNYTHPESLVNIFQTYNLRTEQLTTKNTTKTDNVLLLKDRLSQNKPILLLLGDGLKWQHYVTLVGYGQSEFYLYDSLRPADENGELPGNRTLSSSDLYYYWNRSGYLGYYQRLAIVVDKS